jgi:hypothetical protein
MSVPPLRGIRAGCKASGGGIYYYSAMKLNYPELAIIEQLAKIREKVILNASQYDCMLASGRLAE